MDPFCPVEMEFLSVGLRFCVVSKLSSPVDVLMMHLLAWPVVHILTGAAEIVALIFTGIQTGRAMGRPMQGVV